jgi:hypothetical protein
MTHSGKGFKTQIGIVRLTAPEEFQTKIESMTADAFPKAREHNLKIDLILIVLENHL